jgi:ribosomal protein S18 acetylase RimI-like enzyme
MDILVKILTEDLLEKRISEFIDILADDPHEYWKEEHFKLQLDHKYDISVVAVNLSVIAGYIIASVKTNGPYIHKFFVRKEYRSKTVGKKMLHLFERNIVEKGYRSIDLTVREDNSRAVRFYIRNKFEVTGKRIAVKDKSTLLIMTKYLKLPEE